MFHLPGYFSDQSRDLISRMLVVNLLERYTIEDVRNHPWFNHNVPKYLHESLKDSSVVLEVDSDIVEQLSKAYSIPNEIVFEAAKKKKHENPVNQRIGIAYQLMYDQKFKAVIEKAKRNPHGSGPTSPLMGSESETPDFAPLPVNSQIRLLPVEKSQTKPHVPGRGPTPIIIDDPNKKKGWYNGIRCNRHPADIMTEIYRVLTVFHCEWKCVSPFDIRVRWHRNTHSGNNTIRMSLRLYRIGESKYLLDLQRIEGSSMLFLDISSSVLSRLQVLHN